MLPGEIILEKMVSDNKDDRHEDREDCEDIDAERPPGHPPPILFLLRGLSTRRLEIGDHGDKGSTEKKQRKEVPYFTGQKMFADELHGWVLILAQRPLIATRIVFVLGRTFQQDTAVGNVEDVTIHLPFQRDPLRFFQII